MKETIKKFGKGKILIIGDIMLDKYIYGDTTRINPEAPVPVLKVKEVKHFLGGAANVAANIVSLGGQCFLIGRAGKDEERKILEDLLKEKGIDFSLVEQADYPTVKKTRIVARGQQAIRVDWEKTDLLSQEQEKEILDLIRGRDFDLILVADYAKGLVTRSLMEKLKGLGKKIIVDPKPQNIGLYGDVFLVKPNMIEAKTITGQEDLEKAGLELVEKLNSNVVVTRGKEGASLFTLNGGNHLLPGKVREVYDVTGAGDTFIATLSLALSSGIELKESCVLANQAAGIAVSKPGTTSVARRELLESFEAKNRKIKTLEEMKQIIDDLKQKGKKVVFTNGCFDILHMGHIDLLNKARNFGDVLVLGLNTDNSVKKIKGLERPINNQSERAEILSNLEKVDYIVYFDENDPCKIISELKPDVHVKGGDYDPNNYEQMPEAKVVHDYGGRVEIIDLVKGKSTTGIIERMK